MKEGGEAVENPPAEEAPAEEPPKEEEDKLMEEEKEEEKEEEEKEEEEDDGPKAEEMCCCCVCRCQVPETKPHSCCGCFPIKCGLVTIGIIYLCVLISLFIEIFYCLLNEYIHWWYVPVAVLLLVPMLIGGIFYIRFFTKDQESTRTLLIAAMI